MGNSQRCGYSSRSAVTELAFELALQVLESTPFTTMTNIRKMFPNEQFRKSIHTISFETALLSAILDTRQKIGFADYQKAGNRNGNFS